MESPFSKSDIREIRDVTEWIYRGAKFSVGMEDYPDGSNPAKEMKAWFPWVQDLLRLVDGDSAYSHYYYQGALADQPFLDMAIYDQIRMQWIAERNKDIKPKG